MKILYDDIIYSLQKSGGGSVYWTEIVKPTLDSAEHYVYDNAIDNIFYKQIRDKIKDKRILSSKSLIVKRFINPRCSKEEKFLFHSSYFRYCKNRNAINVTTVHDFTTEKYIKGLHAILHSYQLKKTLKHTAGVICVSENTKKDFKDFFPWYKGELTAIPNGYDNKTYYYEEGINKTKDILFVGARTGYKRFDVAVKITFMLEDCRLVIVGGGQLTNDEKSLLESKLSGKYEKKGFITNDELRHLYNSAFFLCYPSEYEGFGIPLLEAQACGCPVVCQKKSSIPEVAHDTAIYIEAESIEKGIHLIKQLSDPKIYSSYQLKGLENVQRFSWEKSAKEHQHFYKKLWEKNGL